MAPTRALSLNKCNSSELSNAAAKSLLDILPLIISTTFFGSVPSGQRLNVVSSPTVGAVFSAMKTEYVVVEQAHLLGPAPPHISFIVGLYVRY